jgi:hypothetical protein
MATLVSQIITDVQNELIDTSAAFMSAVEQLRLYNRAAKDYVRETRCKKKWTFLSTVANTNELALPADVMTVTKVLYNVPSTSGVDSWRELDPCSLTKFTDFYPNAVSTDTEHKDSPVGYTLVDSKLFFNCPILTAGTNDIAIFYDGRATEVTDTATATDIPDELVEGINAFMIWKAMKKEREFNDAADAQRNYVDYCGKGRGWVKRQLLAGQWKIHLPLNNGTRLEFNPF